MEKVVLKIGGSVLENLPDNFYEMISNLKKLNICDPIIVHGGGPEINKALKQLEVESTFIDGLRVTTKEVLHVAEMVMSGSINKDIVAKLKKVGGVALGLSGVDASLLEASPVDTTKKLGYVGKVEHVNVTWLEQIMDTGAIPVISPIGIDSLGERYNINGDMAASAIASAIGGKLIFISNIPGVKEEIDGKSIIHSHLSKKKIEKMISTGKIYGGMIPKVRSALEALTTGVKETVIINGFTPNDLLHYIEGKQVGTKILIEEVQHV